MPAPFAFDRTWTFPVGADEVWRRLVRTDEYPQWWPWLRAFEMRGTRAPGDAGDGRGFDPGTVASCVVRGPLPYVLRFEVVVEDVVPHELVVTSVRGDLRGPARLELSDADRGGPDTPPSCRVRLAWSVELRAPVVRRLAVAARPAMHWAHDRVVESGQRAFRRAVLDGSTPG